MTRRSKLWTSLAWMKQKYVIERMTEQEIARAAGTTQATINRWLKKHSLKRIN